MEPKRFRAPPIPACTRTPPRRQQDTIRGEEKSGLVQPRQDAIRRQEKSGLIQPRQEATRRQEGDLVQSEQGTIRHQEKGGLARPHQDAIQRQETLAWRPDAGGAEGDRVVGPGQDSIRQ